MYESGNSYSLLDKNGKKFNEWVEIIVNLPLEMRPVPLQLGQATVPPKNSSYCWFPDLAWGLVLLLRVP